MTPISPLIPRPDLDLTSIPEDAEFFPFLQILPRRPARRTPAGRNACLPFVLRRFYASLDDANDENAGMTIAAPTQRTIRILVIGSNGVGKSALIYRFITKRPFDGSPVFDGHTNLTLDGENIRIEVVEWKENMDLENEQTFFDAVIIMYSVTDLLSFDYACEVQRYTLEQKVNIPAVLVEAKTDIKENVEINREEVLNVVKRTQTRLFKVSEKENSNVTAVFAYLVEQALQMKEAEKSRRRAEKACDNSSCGDSIHADLSRPSSGKSAKRCTIM